MKLPAVITMVTVTVCAGNLEAQLSGSAKWADSAAREIEAANATGDLVRLRNAEAMVDRVLSISPNEPVLVYYRALALYRQSSIHLGRKQKDDAKRALNEAERLLDHLTKKAPTADAIALHSSIVGQLISVSSNPLSGMTLGPKSSGLMDKALEMEPSNPRVWLIRGMSAMFTPGMFGGGTENAETYLRKAVALFGADRAVPPAPSWGRADAYIWLGQALQKNSKVEEARVAYTRALELQPENQWVKQVLLPSLKSTK